MNDKNEAFKKNQDKIVIYTRNTSQDQPEGYRVHRDIQILKRKCELAGFEVSKIYCEPSSSCSNTSRPVLKQMLTDADSSLWGGVVVWGIFTLSSDGEELLQIERKLAESGVELISKYEPFDTSTEDGLKVFEYMCKLINTKHLRIAAIQEIPLSRVAVWQIRTENEGRTFIDNLC